MAQKKKPQSAGSDRQAKIQAAASSGAGSGANKIVIAAVAAVVAIVAVVGFVVIKQVQSDNAVKGDGQAVPAGATMGGAYPAYQDVTAKAGAPRFGWKSAPGVPATQCGGHESTKSGDSEK